MTEGYRIGYWRFSAWFVGLSLAIPAASIALKAATGLELGQFAGSIVPIIIAAMQEGVHFARGTKRVPTGKERLLLARMLTAIAVAWSSVLFFVVFLLARPGAELLIGILGPTVIFGAILVMILVMFFMAWLFVGIGSKNEMKLLAKNIAKDFE